MLALLLILPQELQLQDAADDGHAYLDLPRVQDHTARAHLLSLAASTGHVFDPLC